MAYQLHRLEEFELFIFYSVFAGLQSSSKFVLRQDQHVAVSCAHSIERARSVELNERVWRSEDVDTGTLTCLKLTKLDFYRFALIVS